MINVDDFKPLNASRHEISGTFIRFGGHLLVTTIGDGRLVEEWFGDHQHQITQQHINESSDRVCALAIACWADLGPIWGALRCLEQKHFHCS